MQHPRWATDRRGAVARLAGWVAAGAIVWLAILPWLTGQAGVQRHIERNEALGIDPTAKFYTELPAMPRLIEQLESVRRRHRAAFWHPGIAPAQPERSPR